MFLSHPQDRIRNPAIEPTPQGNSAQVKSEQSIRNVKNSISMRAEGAEHYKWKRQKARDANYTERKRVEETSAERRNSRGEYIPFSMSRAEVLNFLPISASERSSTPLSFFRMYRCECRWITVSRMCSRNSWLTDGSRVQYSSTSRAKWKTHRASRRRQGRRLSANHVTCFLAQRPKAPRSAASYADFTKVYTAPCTLHCCMST